MKGFLNYVTEQFKELNRGLTSRKKYFILASNFLLLFILLCVVLSLQNGRWVELLSSDNTARIRQVVQHLGNRGIDYKLLNQRTVQVRQEAKARAAFCLAEEGLLGKEAEPGRELFGQIRLSMAMDRLKMQHQRVLQTELEKWIVEGNPHVMSAYVKIAIPDPALIKSDLGAPSASVKLLTRETLSRRAIQGMQHVLAFAVEKMEPHRVAIVNERNQLLSENRFGECYGDMNDERVACRHRVEEQIRQQLIGELETIAGAENYEVGVSVKMNWPENKTDASTLPSHAQAVISEKTYREKSKIQDEYDPPGVTCSSVDNGIIAKSERTGAVMEETRIHRPFSWDERQRGIETGKMAEVAVSVLLNHIENENGKMIPREQAEMTDIKNVLLQKLKIPSSKLNVSVRQTVFGQSMEKPWTRRRHWAGLFDALKLIIPFVLVFGMGFLTYPILQKIGGKRQAAVR